MGKCLVLNRKFLGECGFLVRECIAEEVEYVRYEESVVRGGRGKEALYLCLCQLRVVRLL